MKKDVPSKKKNNHILAAFSSIGMSKAALEAMNGMNLFGINGASWSVIYIDIDAHYRNRINFDSFLPRESASKVEYSAKQWVVELLFLVPYCIPVNTRGTTFTKCVNMHVRKFSEKGAFF